MTFVGGYNRTEYMRYIWKIKHPISAFFKLGVRFSPESHYL